MSPRAKGKLPAAYASIPKSPSSQSSLTDLSDDHGYSGVEDISNCEDDDEDDVNAAEERNILTEGKLQTSAAPRPHCSRPASVTSDEEADDEGEANDGDDDEEDDEDYKDENDNDKAMSNSMFCGHEADLAVVGQWDPVTGYGPPAALLPESHRSIDEIEQIALEGLLSTENSGTESENYDQIYPDLVLKNDLNPVLRRQIDNSPDPSSDSYTYCEHEADYHPSSFQGAHGNPFLGFPNNDPALQQTGASGGAYPSPQGNFVVEELDSDDLATVIVGPPSPKSDGDARSPSPAFSDEAELESDLQQVHSCESGSKMLRYAYSRSVRTDGRQVVVFDHVKRKNCIVDDDDSLSLALPAAPYLPHQPRTLFPDLGSFQQGLMPMDNLSLTLPDWAQHLSAQNFCGPGFPLPSVASDDPISSGQSFQGETDSGEVDLDLQDFFNFGEDESSADSAVPSSSPAKPAAGAFKPNVLPHLNSTTVGAFRRNQHDQKILMSRDASLDSIFFSSPHLATTVRGLRSDRLGLAESTPLTPPRRPKNIGNPLGGNPFGVGASKRRLSASGEVKDARKRLKRA